jgi:hypothetical protein
VVEVVWNARGAVEVENKPGTARLAAGGVGVVGAANNVDKNRHASAGVEEKAVYALPATVLVGASDGAVADSNINTNAEGPGRDGRGGCGSGNRGSGDPIQEHGGRAAGTAVGGIPCGAVGEDREIAESAVVHSDSAETTFGTNAL